MNGDQLQPPGAPRRKVQLDVLAVMGQQLLSKAFAMHVDLSHHRFHAIHQRGGIGHEGDAADLQFWQPEGNAQRPDSGLQNSPRLIENSALSRAPAIRRGPGFSNFFPTLALLPRRGEVSPQP